MEVFITHDESSPPVPFHLAASKVIIVSTPFLLFFHKSCPIESSARSFNNSTKCMTKIFLESDKFNHKAGVTKHATNTLARKSH